MKTRKPTEPKNPEAVAETAPTIEIRKWGLVKKSREVFRVTEITGEMILDIAQRASKEARLQRLQIRVQEHASSELHEHHTEELDRIKRHFARGTEEATLKLMLSNLELKLLIADTEQYVKPVEVGEKFIEQHTRTDKLGPVAKRVKAHMEKNPKAKPVQVWAALARNPGKNFVYCDNSQGRYIEDAKTGVTKMKWERFRNLVSQHKPKAD